MFTGLTAATMLGVPAGAWLGLHFGWRLTFWAVALIGVVAFAVLALFVPRSRGDALLALGWAAALLTLAGLAVALWSRSLDRRDLPLLGAGACA